MIVSQDLSDIDRRIVMRKIPNGRKKGPPRVYILEDGERISPGDSRVSGWDNYDSIPSDCPQFYKVVGEREDKDKVVVQETGKVFNRSKYGIMLALVDGLSVETFYYIPRKGELFDEHPF